MFVRRPRLGRLPVFDDTLYEPGAGASTTVTGGVLTYVAPEPTPVVVADSLAKNVTNEVKTQPDTVVSTSTAPAVVDSVRQTYIPNVTENFVEASDTIIPGSTTLVANTSGSVLNEEPITDDTLTTQTASDTTTPTSAFPWWLVALAGTFFLN